MTVSLPNETPVSQPVDCTYVAALPPGERMVAWIQDDTCLITPLGETEKGTPVRIVAPFEIPDQTMVYGYCVGSLFCVENVCLFGGVNCADQPMAAKMRLFRAMNTSIPANSSDAPLFFGFPLICTSLDALLEAIPLAGYPIETIHFVCEEKSPRHIYSMKFAQLVNPTHHKKKKPSRARAIPKPLPVQVTHASSAPTTTAATRTFWVKAELGPDQYQLYPSADAISSVGAACIPDYKTSVYMNSLFRKIKENARLDALEESDDEDDFENIDEARFISTDLCLPMQCQYNVKFRAWMPVRECAVSPFQLHNSSSI